MRDPCQPCPTRRDTLAHRAQLGERLLPNGSTSAREALPDGADLGQSRMPNALADP